MTSRVWINKTIWNTKCQNIKGEIRIFGWRSHFTPDKMKCWMCWSLVTLWGCSKYSRLGRVTSIVIALQYRVSLWILHRAAVWLFLLLVHSFISQSELCSSVVLPFLLTYEVYLTQVLHFIYCVQGDVKCKI